MIISRIQLTNWKNFRSVDVSLGNRMFIIGPNASGKSNLLDAFRFLRDLVKQGGGLQQAISERGGLSKIRCLAARQHPDVAIEIDLSEVAGQPAAWRYALAIGQPQKKELPRLVHERVWRGEELILERPEEADANDSLRLTQTHLEQINANEAFRAVHEALSKISYLHLVPQLVRYPEAFTGYNLPGDPFGKYLLDRIASTNKKTSEARLKKIEGALKVAVPHLEHLTWTKDEKGAPHLEAAYRHWRPFGAKQREDQFSDGTLRLIGLLWSLLEGDSLLLLEEPELSLHTNLVSKMPAILYRLQAKKGRQVIISTHSFEMLCDKGIGGEEVLLLRPDAEGSEVIVAADIETIRSLLVSGLSVAEAAMPYSAPDNSDQLDLLKDLFS